MMELLWSGDEGGGNLTFSLVLFLLLLLVLLGDIELNPGPKTGKQQLKLIISIQKQLDLYNSSYNSSCHLIPQ